MILMPYAIAAMPEGEDKRYMKWLYEQHLLLMYKIAWQYSKDRATVEDIVSDTVLALIQKVDTLQQLKRNALADYVATTVRHTAVNYFDKQRRREGHVVHLDVDAIQSVADAQNVEQKIVMDEELDIVWAAINSLPEKEKLVMQMKFQMELSDDVIAGAVGLSVKSIPKYVSRAREHIKAMIYAG